MEKYPNGEHAAFASRPVLGNQFIRALGIAVFAVIAAYFLLLFPFLPDAWRKAGSPELYLTGVAGACLLLFAMVFSAVKRGGGGDLAPTFYVAHVLFAYLGAILVAVHGAGNLSRPPALLYLAIIGLVVLGIFARVHVSRRSARTFAEKHKSFAAELAVSKREKLRSVIDRKRTALNVLDASANEGTFSIQPAHWRSKPLAAWKYAKLEAEERKIMGTRGMVPFAQAYWWYAHRAIAYLLVIGILVHVVTVTFFAGYVADYGEVTWWHLTEW